MRTELLESLKNDLLTRAKRVNSDGHYRGKRAVTRRQAEKELDKESYWRREEILILYFLIPICLHVVKDSINIHVQVTFSIFR